MDPLRRAKNVGSTISSDIEIILWDVGSAMTGSDPGRPVVRNRILKETRPGSIVLSHDIHPGTIEAMPSTFDALEAKGFKFVTVSELIRMAVPQPSQRARRDAREPFQQQSLHHRHHRQLLLQHGSPSGSAKVLSERPIKPRSSVDRLLLGGFKVRSASRFSVWRRAMTK